MADKSLPKWIENNSSADNIAIQESENDSVNGLRYSGTPQKLTSAKIMHSVPKKEQQNHIH